MLSVSPEGLVQESAALKLFDPFRDGVTQGALGNWLMCREKARLRSLEMLGMEGSKDAIEFGNVIHNNLERVYRWYGEMSDGAKAVGGPEYTIPDIHLVSNKSMRILTGQEEETIRDTTLNMGQASFIEKMQFTYGIAVPILENYFRQWPEDFTSREWITLEEEFAVPIEVVVGSETYTIYLRGKIDGIFRSMFGSKGLWLMDHKSKARFDEESLAMRLPMDLQMGIYMLAVEKLYGEAPVGFIYNLIRRPMLRQKQNETLYQLADRIRDDIPTRMDFYYTRMEVIVEAEAAMTFRQHLSRVLSEYIGWYLGEQAHYRNPMSCHNGMYSCEFMQFCSGGGLAGYTRKDRPYPELTEGEFTHLIQKS